MKKKINNIIPIVFVVNDNYAPYLGVALHSLMTKTSEKYFYDVNILYSNLSDTYKLKIRSLNHHSNISINFIDVTKQVCMLEIPAKGHLAPEAVYRLLCGQLFPNYEKILYLDCDVIIKNDVSNLYNIDIGTNIIGAAKAFLSAHAANYIGQNDVFSLDTYFNSGVLPINIPEFIKAGVDKQGLVMLTGQHQYLYQDQDVLNILCKDRVCFFDKNWNMEWLPLIYSQMTLIEYEKFICGICNANIVHYSSRIKPWNRPDISCANLFWREAQQTEFYEEIINSMTQNTAKEYAYKMLESQRFPFPWKNIHDDKRIIIYGVGAVGQSYIWQISLYNHCKLVAVCDQEPNKKYHNENIRFILPSEIINIEYDYIVIASIRETTVHEIIRELLFLGIPKNKIVHTNGGFCAD